MKKYFLTMLIGLLPLMGWAAEEPPVVKLASVETEYNGNNTAQPALSTACRMYGDVIIAVKYLGHEGDQDPVTTWDIDDINTWDNYPVRDAGEYIVVVERDGSHNGRVETPRAPMKAEGDGETAIGGDGNDEGDNDDEIGEIFELTYTVLPLDRPCKLANCEKVYGAEFPEPRYYNDNAWPAGDSKNVFQGGKIVFSDLGFDAVGTQAIWYTGKVYIRKPNGEIDYNYVNPVTGGGTATCDVTPAKIYAHALDKVKTFGQCDDDAQLTDETAQKGYEYLGWVKPLGENTKLDTYETQVTAGKNTETVVRADGQDGEDVGEYDLIVKHDQVKFKNYVIVDEPFEEGQPEQGKLTIEKKSLKTLTDDDIAIKWFIDGKEVTDLTGFTYGQTLTWEIAITDHNVCATKFENGEYTLKKTEYNTPECVDGDCSNLEICAPEEGGNYKDCVPFTVPDPKAKCLTIAAYVEAETLQAFDAVPEIGYTIEGWVEGDGTAENIALVEALLTPKFYKATKDDEGKLVKGDAFTGKTLDAGDYIIEVEIDQTNWPEALKLYKVGGECGDPTGTDITVEPVCIEDATINIVRTEGAENCFPVTGSEIEPEITVTFNGKELKETDYDVTYSNNVHVSEEGGKITVTGKGNYACEVETTFCIAPGNATVYVLKPNFDVYEEILDPKGNTVKQYQNGKFYAQYESENNITLAYEGITPKQLKDLGLDIKGKRFGGETVGFYSVAIFNGDEQLTPGELKYEGETAVETSNLVQDSKTFGDITITFKPGLYEIKKNSEPLSYEWNPTKVYGELSLDLTRMKDPTYIEDLKALYREEFKGATYHGLDNDAKALIDKNIINIDAITMADIHVSPVVDGVVGDEYTIEQFAALVKRTHGNIPVGKYFVNITGATSVNYQLGTVTMNVEVTPRPIGIKFDDQTSGKHGSFNADAVTYQIVEVAGKDIQGLATGDNDATDLNIKAKLDGENITLDEEAFFDDTKVSGVYKYIGMNYEPIVTDGKYIIDDEPLHFIIHRTARNINWIDKEQTEETDLAISTWNDTEDRIIAFDGETVPTVYFRTFNAAKVADDNLEDLFKDGELEPITYKDKDGNVADEDGGFWLYSNKWYSMVLPFDIYVYEFGTHPVFGHAVINVLDERNADPLKMQFKLQEVGIIKANTPFIFKVGDKGDPDTYLETTGEGEDEMAITPIANLDELTFTNKKIVKPENFEEIFVEDASGLRFYGDYNGKGKLAEYEYYFSIAPMLESFDGYYFGSADNTSWLYPSTCYGVDGNHAAGARQLIVQEEDGSFTAIKSIENVTYTNNAEGWFTTNGMKLNAQPTQRGIYIHNGKKVVVK